MKRSILGIAWFLALAFVVSLAIGGQAPDRRERASGGDRQRPDGQERRRLGPERRGPEMGPGRPQNPIMQALDTNGDGELSADEIAGAGAVLKSLDKNGDGKLSDDELRPPRPNRQGELDRPQRPGDDRSTSGDPRRGPGGGARDSGRGGPGPGRPSGDMTLRRETSTVPDRPLQKLPPSPVNGFVAISGGVFEMGDHHDLGGQEHRNDEVPIHTVRVDSFYMSATEMTNKQYCEFLNAAWSQKRITVKDGFVRNAQGDQIYCDTRQSDVAGSLEFDGRKFSVAGGRADHPVVCVRWHGAAACCNWLSEKHGYEPCYDLTTGKCDYTKKGFRLPSEAEWEYAGRGGLHDPYRIFPWGDDADNSKANWPNSGDPYESGPYPWTTPVAFYNGKLHRKTDFGWPGPQSTYQTSNGANGYGLYDMAGNVWEWVNDWYNRDYYATCPADNPPGPDQGTPVADGQTYRVLRGGNWFNGQQGHSRVSNRNPSYYRGPDDPNHSYYHIGFRPVLSVGSVSNRSSETTTTRTLGVFRNDPGAFNGYTLFAPKHNTVTYLIDNDGRIVNSWQSEYEPGQSVYLLPNGHLLHCCFTKNKGFTRGGEGGRLEEFDWEGNLVWEFEYSSDEYLSHHDIAPLPNGNVLVLAVEKKSYDEAIAAGFDARMLRDQQLFPEFIIEVQPTRPKGGKIVWEWHVWDHLIQDNDRSKSNYGDVAAHPELIDVDCNGRPVPAFWNHANSIDYNPSLDQIVISARGCNELWVIDHSTTAKEAAGHLGGKRGKGGDLLYRWGNAAAYGRGTSDDRQLFQQHDAQWIPDGCPGAGNLMIFNNGYDRGFSTVEEIVPPMDQHGNYVLERNKAFGPAKPVWHYEAERREDFFSSEISGAHRLPNGNTLVCEGVHGKFFEVTREGKAVWEYVNAMVRGGILAQGEKPGLDHRGHQWNAVFKIHRYAPDYPGLSGKDLTPGKVIELPAGQISGLGGATEEQFGKRPANRPDAGDVRGGNRDKRGQGQRGPGQPGRGDNRGQGGRRGPQRRNL